VGTQNTKLVANDHFQANTEKLRTADLVDYGNVGLQTRMRKPEEKVLEISGSGQRCCK